jgi:hypothetical protein
MSRTIASFLLDLSLIAVCGVAVGQESSPTPSYLSDRGTGVPASLFGTYIREGELLIYPSYEYVIDDNREYQPEEFGLGPDVDFRGKFRSSAAQIFVGYGVTDWLALEFEAGYLKATLEKSALDPFPVPVKTEESGFGDIEGQIRARLWKETDHRPEIFSYLEITAPSQKDKVLIGDPDWEFRLGGGVIRGFRWGTMTFRGTVEYNRAESHWDLGEFSLEYLKRLSPRWRLFVAYEGGESGALDEWELITGLQWRISKLATLKLDNSIGTMSKAPDWTPQIGILFSFPP